MAQNNNMGYSVDLREKVVEYYNECKNITRTCNTFKIARSTLYSWITLHKENGNLKPKVRTEHTTKIDYDKLKNLVEEMPDAFLREYAAYFGVTTVAIWSALKKLKITRKKRLLPTKKLIQKRKQTLENASKQ